MAWDRDRHVPWARLVKQFTVYLVVFNLALALFARDDYGPAVIVGSLAGAGLYVLIAWVLVKFGWSVPGDRRAMAAQRAAARERRAAARAARTAPAPEAPRARPAPTRRTSGGRAGRAPQRRR